jgi:hypothetical protein
MVVHSCNHSAQETEVIESRVQDHTPLPPKKKKAYDKHTDLLLIVSTVSLDLV